MTVTSVDPVDALAPFATLPDWLAGLMRPGALDASLRANVPELRDGRLQLVECRADRLRAKGEDWLARCRAIVAEPGGTPREVVLVGVVLPPGRPEPVLPPGTAAAFGSLDYEGWFGDLRLHVRNEESDPALPALATLVDPSASARLIQRLLNDGAYPEARVRECRPNVVRYKPGSRCTIVYRLDYEPADRTLPDPVVAKTHQGDKGRVAHEAMQALWDTRLADGDVVRLAEPLGYLPEDRVLLQGPVPEARTLKELAREAFSSEDPARLATLRSELAKTAVALAALHRSGARYGRVVTWGDELEEVREVLARLGTTVPGIREAADPMLSWLERVDSALPADPVVSAHHDFRPAQVLLSDGPVGFIDFDGAAMAEPALDLGRFRGKLRDIGISALAVDGNGQEEARVAERLRLLDELCDGFLSAYQAEAPVSVGRVLLWETIDLLTAVLHTWTKVRLLRVRPRLAVLEHQLRGLEREDAFR